MFMYVVRLCVSVLALFISFHCYSQETAVSPKGVFINKLINESSGAKQVKKSNNPEVKKLHQLAKDLYKQANEKLAIGEESEAASILDQSAKKMFEAIRLSTPVSLSDNKIKHDYDNRKKSVTALREAFERISLEKNDQVIKENVNNQLTKMLKTSAELEQAGKYAPAKQELNKAYVLLKQSIESLRSGQTLVRSLNFATAEEEYHYELDRNDTHKMLVTLLLGEKQNSAYTQKAVSKFTQEAASLRKQAEQAASDDDFKQAISLLEQSTKQFVRAIRSAGVYIPG